MRAALLHAIGEEPRPGEAPEPQPEPGDAVVETAAAPLNPVDVAIGEGRFYGGHPPLPYVVGREGIGRVVGGDRWPAGTRVYSIFAPGGTAAARFVPGPLAWELPDGDDAVAAALGIPGLAAWVALEHHAGVGAGDRVLVLAATGTLGLVGVQAARILGAERVVAAGRDERRLAVARERGADAVVPLAGDLEEAFRGAFPDGGPDVVLDPLWGAPAQAAVAVAEPGARIVNVGQSAGADATLTSAAVRGRQLRLLGLSVFANPVEVLAPAHRRLVAEAEAGRLVIDVERHPLDDVAAAWQAVRAGARKPVLVL